MRYLIDTDWAIDYLRDVPRVADRVEALRADGIAISIISIAELFVYCDDRCPSWANGANE